MNGRARMAAVIDHNHAQSGAEYYFRAALWMAGLQRPPKVGEVQLRFGVCRATAYRWLSAFRAASGVA